MKLSEGLKRVRKLQSKTQHEIAMTLGITDRGYQSYELEEREPPISKLMLLADYYDVSLDYLVGRADTPCLPEA